MKLNIKRIGSGLPRSYFASQSCGTKIQRKGLHLKNKLAQINMIHESANKSYKNKNKNRNNWFIHEQGKIYIIPRSAKTEAQNTKIKPRTSYG